jgi:hypothetical protein
MEEMGCHMDWGEWPGAKWPHELDLDEVRLLSTERQSNSPARFPPQSQGSVSPVPTLPTTTETLRLHKCPRSGRAQILWSPNHRPL